MSFVLCTSRPIRFFLSYSYCFFVFLGNCQTYVRNDFLIATGINVIINLKCGLILLVALQQCEGPGVYSILLSIGTLSISGQTVDLEIQLFTIWSAYERASSGMPGA